MILTALKLNNFIRTLEVVKANCTLSHFFKQNVSEWEVLNIPNDFPVLYPALGHYRQSVPVQLSITLHSSYRDYESKDGKDNDEDGNRHEGAKNQQTNPDRMDEHVLRVTIFGLETFPFVHLFVQTDSAELDDNETYVHRQLEENQAYGLGNEFVCGRAQVDCERSEDCEACDDEGQLSECLTDPNLLVSGVERPHIDKTSVQVQAHQRYYHNKLQDNLVYYLL